MKTVLIAGGSGLIGNGIIPILEENGYSTRVLSRKPNNKSHYYFWDPEKNLVDKLAFENCDVIINLAGEGIAKKRWSNKRKAEILNSRVRSTHLLHQVLTTYEHQVKLFINASAIGIYGNAGEETLYETAPAGDGFLPETCRQWELAAKQVEATGYRTIILRFGPVLSSAGGMLRELLKPLRIGVLPVFGNGDQYQSWIHIEDLGRLICHVAKNDQLHGIFNAVAPAPVTHKEFMNQIQQVKKKKYLKIQLPAPVLRLMLGEMTTMLLDSAKVSCSKIEDSGFEFKYPQLDVALKNLLGRN